MGEERQSSTRFAIPLIIFGVLVLIVVLVSFGGGSSGPASDSADQKQSQGQTGRRFYIVKQGDSLGTISEKTGVSVEDLRALNPDVDPQTLIAGQRLKLR